MKTGRVALVGAGPGDPELLTLKALRLIQSADVIAYDRLIDGRILAHAPADAELIDVGKVVGESGRSQLDINRTLVDRASNGRSVVRLKGGDPFVLGRGGEEAEALQAAGIPFEIVPGVTSAIAAPAYAGIPLTHRDHASSFTVVAGSTASAGSEEVDWDAIAAVGGTLVVLMGWRNLETIVSGLLAGGKPADTPAAIVTWGTLPWQTTVAGCLGSIVEQAKSAGLGAPAAVVIGSVVRLRERLSWFETLPLFGRRILITRTRNQAGRLSSRLAELGAVPLEVPTIEVQPLSDFTEFDVRLASAREYDWIVFTSANVVRAVFDRLRSMGRDARVLQGVWIACIGPATSVALSEAGVQADLTPTTTTSRGLARDLGNHGVAGKRILLPRSGIAGQDLPDRLRSHGGLVDEVVCYQTVIPEESRDAAASLVAEGVDAVTFTSSSTVRNLLRLLDGDPSRLDDSTIACIGPVTAETAGRLGLKVDIVADAPTIEGLVSSLAEWFASR